MLPNLDEIKQRRKKIGLTQFELAKEAGISQSLIAKIESKKVEPSYSAVQKIFDVLQRHESKKSLKAKDIMSKNMLLVQKDDKISKAIKVMKENNFSQLPVFSEKHLVGSISEKAILDKTIEIGVKSVSSLLVKDIMTNPFPTVAEDTPLNVLLTLLQHNWAVLITRKDDIVGIVTAADIFKVV